MHFSKAKKKYNLVSDVKLKTKTFRYFRDDPVLNIETTMHSSLDLCGIFACQFRLGNNLQIWMFQNCSNGQLKAHKS